jgi:hypothetical protein
MVFSRVAQKSYFLAESSVAESSCRRNVFRDSRSTQVYDVYEVANIKILNCKRLHSYLKIIEASDVVRFYAIYSK